VIYGKTCNTATASRNMLQFVGVECWVEKLLAGEVVFKLEVVEAAT
jgi:hypothetical protein